MVWVRKKTTCHFMKKSMKKMNVPVVKACYKHSEDQGPNDMKVRSRHTRSGPRIRRASCRSFIIIVLRPPCSMHITLSAIMPSR